MQFTLNSTSKVTEFVGYPEETDSICPACGESPQYCQGHGEIGDSEGYCIIEMHECDNHTTCRFGECVS